MNERKEYYLEPHMQKLRSDISTWSKDELIDLIMQKADTDPGFYRLISLKIHNAGTDSILIHKWNTIQENILNLSYEKYIDDQVEISVIWQTCFEIIRFLEYNDVPHAEMKEILQDILMHGYYDHVGCYDPMYALADCLFNKLDTSGKVAC